LDPPIIVGLIAASLRACRGSVLHASTYNSYQTDLLLVPPRRDKYAHRR